MYKRLIPALAALLLAAGCASVPTEIVDPHNDTGPRAMALDYRDFNAAAADALRSIREEGIVDKPGGGRYVVFVGRIINDTTQTHWDPDQLTKIVTIELRRSGKVVVTLVPPEAPASAGMHPELVLTGKVHEGNMQLDSRRKQTEYYLQLELTDPKTMLVFWEGQAPIIKRGSAKTTNW